MSVSTDQIESAPEKMIVDSVRGFMRANLRIFADAGRELDDLASLQNVWSDDRKQAKKRPSSLRKGRVPKPNLLRRYLKAMDWTKEPYHDVRSYKDPSKREVLEKRILLLFWLIVEPDAGKITPEVCVFQSWPWTNESKKYGFPREQARVIEYARAGEAVGTVRHLFQLAESALKSVLRMSEVPLVSDEVDGNHLERLVAAIATESNKIRDGILNAIPIRKRGLRVEVERLVKDLPGALQLSREPYDYSDRWIEWRKIDSELRTNARNESKRCLDPKETRIAIDIAINAFKLFFEAAHPIQFKALPRFIDPVNLDMGTGSPESKELSKEFITASQDLERALLGLDQYRRDLSLADDSKAEETPVNNLLNPTPTKDEPVMQFDRDIPPLNTEDGQWVKNKMAAKLENVETDTLTTYRKKGSRSPDRMVGIDPDGRKWRRRGTTTSHAWYLKSSLKSQK